MKARISRDGEFTIVELSGYLDFESSNPLKQSIAAIFRSDQQAKVLIDLQDLEFVGSSGVSSFVKSLAGFNTLKMKPFYFGVKSEFMRLFRAFEEEDEPFAVCATKDAARDAAFERLQQWQMSRSSKRTH